MIFIFVLSFIFPVRQLLTQIPLSYSKNPSCLSQLHCLRFIDLFLIYRQKFLYSVTFLTEHKSCYLIRASPSSKKQFQWSEDMQGIHLGQFGLSLKKDQAWVCRYRLGGTCKFTCHVILITSVRPVPKRLALDQCRAYNQTCSVI